jgi:hypothetical protein
MIRVRRQRQNTIWISLIGTLTAIALIGNPATAPVLLPMVIGAAGAAFIQIDDRRNPLVNRLNPATAVKSAMTGATAQAQEAARRASVRGFSQNPGIGLLDIGLIALERENQGATLRRTQSVSKDDDGVRPYLVLNIDPAEADRNARLRFEIIDQNGKEVYVYEMNLFLRDGELNILPDHHLPLRSNPQIAGMGEWDLRVYLDRTMLGVHTFSFTPSSEERAARLSGRSERPRRYVMAQTQEKQDSEVWSSSEPAQEERPPQTLEELLRSQKDQQNQQRKQ